MTNHIIAAHVCGSAAVIADRADGSFDVIPIAHPRAVSAKPLAPNAAFIEFEDGSFDVAIKRDVNPNAGVRQAYPGGRW